MNRLRLELVYQLRYGLPCWLVLLVTGWMPDVGPAIRLRGLLASFFLPGRPAKLRLGRDVTLLSVNRLRIGTNVYIAKGSWLNAVGGLTLEDEVILGPYVVMSSNNHGFRDGSAQRGGAHPAPIKVGFGSWLAAHCVITGGVSLGRGNLVAANSVVTRDTPDNVVVAGVPAQPVKPRKDNPSELHSKHDIGVAR